MPSAPDPTPTKPPPPGVAVLNCPSCGAVVRLPATTCPSCQADLRTGERPEEYVPLWRRKKTKLLILLILVGLPASAYSIIYSQSEEGVAAYIRHRLGTCAEPREKWQEFSQEEFENKVKRGYSAWNSGDNTRVTGQSAKGPETPEEAAMTETEKLVSRDNQTYFATALTSSGPAKSLSPKDNWYATMGGEWDVAYILGGEGGALIAGEWTFSWINNGQAIEDVLSVPYQWGKPPEGVEPIQMTTVRMLNQKRGDWEGIHVIDGAMVYFRTAKAASGQIEERYQIEGAPMTLWTYSEVLQDSFKVTISQTTDQGATRRVVAELWCKRRQTVVP